MFLIGGLRMSRGQNGMISGGGSSVRGWKGNTELEHWAGDECHVVDSLAIGPAIQEWWIKEVSNKVKDRASIQIFFQTERLPKFF